MSSVPFYAVNTSCRTAECPRSPFRAKKIQLEATETRRRAQSLNEKTTNSTLATPPSPSPSPQVAALRLSDVRIRSSSLDHLQTLNKQQQQQQQMMSSNRERFMEALGVFN